MSELLRESIALWRESPVCLPAMERSFDADQQAARETGLRQFLDSIEAEARRLPRTRSERGAARERITAAFLRFAKSGADLEDRHLELLLDGGFSTIGTELARQARRFDPTVATADILQASRNAWTACGLQILLGQNMRLTPAIFAYSMLYPYTDNYLDDPAASREAKLGFSARFGRRLGGEAVSPANARESSIFGLVALIENQYARAQWPQVFTSLLRIHRAQENSLRLRRSGAGAGHVDVLTLGFEKGGASVLADGYLAAGSLSSDEARFVFDWGVLLQLADDLQDVEQDCRDGVLTLFSAAVGREPLDELTNRTLHFAQTIMRRMDGLPRSACPALQDLIRRSSWSLLIRSAGEAGALYSRDYIHELETHSPYRFAFLRDRRRQLARRGSRLAKLFDAFLEGDADEPAFPVLPSSLLPRS